jgi:ubiquinone/menaquinone biosynthesis C-methylase UbiE
MRLGRVRTSITGGVRVPVARHVIWTLRVFEKFDTHPLLPVKQTDYGLISPGESILEIGFGTGHCLAALAEAVGPQGKVFGLDISEGVLAQTAAMLARKGLTDRVDLRRGDATLLPYTDGVLDGVFMCFTLELFDTQEIPLFLRECRRVLKSSAGYPW